MGRRVRIVLGSMTWESPHPFEEELEWVVRVNHKLVMDSIARIESHPNPEDGDFYPSELRKAANSLALVGLITTFHYWVSVFVEELTNKSAIDETLASNLKTLMTRLGKAPIPNVYFVQLVAVRNSIIHAHSKIKWSKGKAIKEVPKQYANKSTGEIEFTQQHLHIAIKRSVQQVRWYDDRLEALKVPKKH